MEHGLGNFTLKLMINVLSKKSGEGVTPHCLDHLQTIDTFPFKVYTEKSLENRPSQFCHNIDYIILSVLTSMI